MKFGRVVSEICRHTHYSVFANVNKVSIQTHCKVIVSNKQTYLTSKHDLDEKIV